MIGPVRTIGNILWLLLAGIWMAISYVIAGVVQCITIIGIPFGIQSFKLAGYALWPFGRVVVQRPGSLGGLSCVGNVIWFVLSGLWLAIGHVLTGAPAVHHDHRDPVRHRLVQARRPGPDAVRQGHRPRRRAVAAGIAGLPGRLIDRLANGVDAVPDVGEPSRQRRAAEADDVRSPDVGDHAAAR